MTRTSGLVRVSEDTVVSWLRMRSMTDGATGFDPAGWEASTWILHAMYERSDLELDLTFADLHRHVVAGGATGRDLTDWDVDDVVHQLTGKSLGWAERRDPDWQRLRWSALAQRLGVPLDGEYPPSVGWFPYDSWPVTIQGPDDGTLDDVSLRRLLHWLSQLDERGSSSPCFAFFAPSATGRWDDVEAFYGPLEGIPALVDEAGWFGTPHNVWAEDRSWFVYTDEDLCSTKVSGSADLIGQLEADAELETLRWEPLGRR